MREAICECGNKFFYITVNDKIQCKECDAILDAIPTPIEEINPIEGDKDGVEV